MQNLFWVVKRKLRSRRGLTLVELLISLALMTILTVGTTTGISATSPVLKKSLMLSESQLLLDTLTKAISGELRYATDIAPATSNASPPLKPGETHSFPMDFTYSSKEYGPEARFYNALSADGAQLRIMVQDGGYDFVGSGVYADLGAKIVSITYDGANRVFNVELQIIFPDGTEESHTFAVQPVLIV